MALLFFIDLPPILHFVSYELCYEYIMKFIFVAFLADDLDVVEPVCSACVFRLSYHELYARVRVGRMSLSRDCSFVGVSLCFIF